MKRTSRKPKRTSRRPRKAGVRRNGMFDSMFKSTKWGYALYDKNGKRVLYDQAGAGSRSEAEAVAFFAYGHMPGTLVAIAYDRGHWDPPPAQWTHEWQSAAIHEGIDGMTVWGHFLGDEPRVAKTMQMPAMTRQEAAEARENEALRAPTVRNGDIGEGRDRRTGRYTHSTEAMCTCGHGIGLHAAVSVGGERPCFAGDFGHEFCGCKKFKKVRAKKPGVV